MGISGQSNRFEKCLKFDLIKLLIFAYFVLRTQSLVDEQDNNADNRGVKYWHPHRGPCIVRWSTVFQLGILFAAWFDLGKHEPT